MIRKRFTNVYRSTAAHVSPRSTLTVPTKTRRHARPPRKTRKHARPPSKLSPTGKSRVAAEKLRKAAAEQEKQRKRSAAHHVRSRRVLTVLTKTRKHARPLRKLPHPRRRTSNKPLRQEHTSAFSTASPPTPPTAVSSSQSSSLHSPKFSANPRNSSSQPLHQVAARLTQFSQIYEERIYLFQCRIAKLLWLPSSPAWPLTTSRFLGWSYQSILGLHNQHIINPEALQSSASLQRSCSLHQGRRTQSPNTLSTHHSH
jgi:hypothetical protein